MKPMRPTPELVRQCRFCGCTPEHPCKVHGGDECCFLGPKADRCSAPACIVAFNIEYDQSIAKEKARLRLIRKLGKRWGKRKPKHQRRAA